MADTLIDGILFSQIRISAGPARYELRWALQQARSTVGDDGANEMKMGLPRYVNMKQRVMAWSEGCQ